MSTANDIVSILTKRVGFEALAVDPSDNQLRLIGRIPPNAQSHWVLVIHKLLVATERTQWKVDISRFYFTRVVGNNQKRLFYSWRVIFQGQNIGQFYKAICACINDAPRPARVELQEFPLTGAQRQHQNGKGAYTAETSPLVASVAAAARMGGVRS